MERKEKSPSVTHRAADELTQDQTPILDVAIEKLVRIAEQSGVPTDELIALLNAGMTVHELLDYVASKTAPIV
jgi:hypothetical protein